MANVKFPRKEFEKELGKKITREIEEQISLLGTPLESLTQSEIEIEVFPNRPDLLSMQGYVRALKAFLGKETGLKKYTVRPPEKNYTVRINKNVQNVRPYTSCAIIRGLKLDDQKIIELINVQEKIHSTLGRNRKKAAIGIYPLEKITLPISYEARKPADIVFQPLESKREMNASQILKRHPKGIQYADLLKGLSHYPVFVDARKKILSMPPVINSEETGKITSSTHDVFIECSGFNQEILDKILNILITALSDMQGKVYQMDLLYEGNKKRTTPNLNPGKIKISLQNTNKLLGIELKEKDLSHLLSKMGYDCKKEKNTLEVSVPAWRTDILHEVDIIEDIAIAYGYNNFLPEIPTISTIGERPFSKSAYCIPLGCL